MAITILAPEPVAEPYESDRDSAEDSDDGGANLEGDIDMQPKKRRRNDYDDVVTPGQSVTDDPQWMRYS